MINFKKLILTPFIVFGVCGFLFALAAQAGSGTPDLTVTDISFSGSQKGQSGKLSVTIKNVGGDLKNSSGLLNFYNNFSSQNFVFDSSTSSINDFKTNRSLPSYSNPLATNESITFSWYGSFNTSGNLYLNFKVDNADELNELNEENNSFSDLVVISDTGKKPDLIVSDISFSTNYANQLGTVSVTIKNAGTAPLTSSKGLLNAYFNLSVQKFVFDPETQTQSLKTTRPLPSDSYPLKPGESISRLWLGKFTEIGKYYLDYTVDNGNELGELDESNNSYSRIITINANYPGTGNSSYSEIGNDTFNSESAVNNFLVYGVDANTQKLGAGERAAVVYSYKNAFGKAPESEAEFNDLIRIANGRWPRVTSQVAENRAKEQFKKIYKRTADMENSRDNAAVTIMAYGLKQKAENRNLKSEAAGIKTFKAVYGYNPKSTEDWNIVQAITYSGASR